MKLKSNALMAAMLGLAVLSIPTGASARDRDWNDGPRWDQRDRGWEHRNQWDNHRDWRWDGHRYIRGRDRVVIYGPPVVYGPPTYYGPAVYGPSYYGYPDSPSLTIGINLPPIVIH